jgi:hypothetical protein
LSRRAVLAAAAALIWPTIAGAQSCCSPSLTPGSAIVHHVLGGGRWQVGLLAQYMALAGGRSGTETVPYPNDRESNAETLALTGRYGLSSRFTLGAVVPYVWRERSDLAADGTRVSRSASGLGDVALLAYARLLPALRPSEWTAGVGLKLATGESRAEDETGELPLELQPGTGANDLLATTLFTRGLGSFSASGGLTWRLTGTFTKVDAYPDSSYEIEQEYEFGNELLYGLSAAWTPDFRLALQLGLQGRHAEPDEATRLNPDGTTGERETLPSTGGDWLWISPVVRYATPAGGLTAAFVALLPVYEDLEGTQLSTEPGGQLLVEITF